MALHGTSNRTISCPAYSSAEHASMRGFRCSDYPLALALRNRLLHRISKSVSYDTALHLAVHASSESNLRNQIFILHIALYSIVNNRYSTVCYGMREVIKPKPGSLHMPRCLSNDKILDYHQFSKMLRGSNRDGLIFRFRGFLRAFAIQKIITCISLQRPNMLEEIEFGAIACATLGLGALLI